MNLFSTVSLVNFLADSHASPDPRCTVPGRLIQSMPESKESGVHCTDSQRRTQSEKAVLCALR